METAVDETCSSLAADGHDVAVVTGPAPGNLGLRRVRRRYDARAVLPQLVGAYKASLGEAPGAPLAAPAGAFLPGPQTLGT